MPRAAGLKRRAFFVDEEALCRAGKALGVATNAEVVRLSVARIAEMEEFWRLRKPSSAAARTLQDAVTLAILGTSIYIGHWERELYEEA